MSIYVKACHGWIGGYNSKCLVSPVRVCSSKPDILYVYRCICSNCSVFTVCMFLKARQHSVRLPFHLLQLLRVYCTVYVPQSQTTYCNCTFTVASAPAAPCLLYMFLTARHTVRLPLHMLQLLGLYAKFRLFLGQCAAWRWPAENPRVKEGVENMLTHAMDRVKLAADTSGVGSMLLQLC